MFCNANSALNLVQHCKTFCITLSFFLPSPHSLLELYFSFFSVFLLVFSVAFIFFLCSPCLLVLNFFFLFSSVFITLHSALNFILFLSLFFCFSFSLSRVFTPAVCPDSLHAFATNTPLQNGPLIGGVLNMIYLS